MQRRCAGLLSLGLGILCMTSNARADLASEIAEQGGSKMLVNAGAAIQSTCGALVGRRRKPNGAKCRPAAGPLFPLQRDGHDIRPGHTEPHREQLRFRQRCQSIQRRTPVFRRRSIDPATTRHGGPQPPVRRYRRADLCHPARRPWRQFRYRHELRQFDPCRSDTVVRWSSG